ncbi:TPA: UDP-N-acetylmuramoyl-tripeptide--D-alanyl-D-alanine ligase [Candidatus Sumerlaeota bacterium]|jgi:UDP-N-acetylmuramoyl-tripeptide--D-alanyl-D-alanine ligase|nr:UDP-N-acetylmuramoyl-tripeptide--D-alanyl-D-alanine ligase [Candidatus Sumerlaeota bacterium]
MQLSADEILKATGGEWLVAPSADFCVTAISTDSRTVGRGDLFVALKGENFDAHAFLSSVVEKGASGVVVERAEAAEPLQGRVPVLLVKNTLRALGAMATAWRTQCSAHRIAVVGSAGKTTTKEMLAHLLRRFAGSDDAVLSTAGNFNNLIGLPLTLFRLTPEHKFAVLEMGMNEPGELAKLTPMGDPELLVLLGVGSAHVGQFGSREALLEAKAEAVRFAKDSMQILYDTGNENTREIILKYGDDHPTLTFAVESPAEIRASNIRVEHGKGYRFDLDFGGKVFVVHLPMFGRHNVTNATAAAAAAFMQGVPPEMICSAFQDFRPAAMRSEVREQNGVTLVVDCYNASPEGMIGALDSLKDWRVPGETGKLHLVLGQMLELGAESRELHAQVGKHAAKLRPDAVYLFGEEMRVVAEEWKGEKGGVRFCESREEIAEKLCESVKPGDVVFFKGSRGNKLETVVEALK